MPVYLIRHAEAVAEQHPLVDESRYLTAAGRDAARLVGRGLVASGVALDALYTSPLVRAVQTAELLAPAAGFNGTVEVLPDLVPGGDLRGLVARFGGDDRAVGLVGHEPGMSALAALLTSRGRFRMLDKAEIVAIEGGQPLWTMRPGDPAPTPWE